MAITLASIANNKPKPPITVIHGDPGVGKTTFCAYAPSPIFILTEDGLGNLEMPAFPLANSYHAVLEAFSSLLNERHEYKTVILDSLDWLEPLIWEQVCQAHKVSSIESLGYGKGYVEATYIWRDFLDLIKRLRDERSILTIMTAHSSIVKVDDPSMPAYDTRDLKLHKKASALVEEFADVILYATTQTTMITEKEGFDSTRNRAITTGERIMHTVGQPAFLAKNRYSLPSPLPLTWDAFSAAMWHTN